MEQRRHHSPRKYKTLKEIYKPGVDKLPPLEHTTQEALRELMKSKNWLTEKVHGSLTMRGWPDLYCYHPTFKTRWIECKRMGGGSYLNDAQVARFKKWAQHGLGVWVLRGPDEYDLLFSQPNWHLYCRHMKWK